MMAEAEFELPNPFRSDAGGQVRTASQWTVRRREIHERMVPIAYGDLPRVPRLTRCVELHTAVVKRLGGARLLSCRVEADGRHAFLLRVFAPLGQGPFAVLLNGDGCWHYASDEVIAAVLDRGNVFAQFNRVEIAPDTAHAHAAQKPNRLFRWI